MRRIHPNINTSFTVSRESIELSREYDEVDFTSFIPGISVWRAITNKSKTRIEVPTILLIYMLNYKTQFLNLLQNFGHLDILVGLVSHLKNSKNKSMYMNWNESTAAKQIVDNNAYREFFIMHKNRDEGDYEELKAIFDIFKDCISVLKKSYCRPIKERYLTTAEISLMKLFNPSKARNEIENALKYYKEHDYKKVYALAVQCAKFCDEQIIKYIEKNVFMD